tara:strand:- start:343 stop:822 length:480 start_codon:yes stop_codon:yes gene_type:complete
LWASSNDEVEVGSMTPPAHVAAKKKLFQDSVLLAKSILGTPTLNKLRGEVIKSHSKIITKFVDTYDSTFGKQAMENIFRFADEDDNGQLDAAELKKLLTNGLGFVWLDEKKVDDLVSRFDVDNNKMISFEEFSDQFPKVLRTNLIKLAKANGDDLGFLS